MSPAATQRGLLDEDWRERGDEFAKYQPLVKQISNYLNGTKPSTVPDLYILEIEDFVDHLYRKADDKKWGLVAKKVLKAMYAIVSSLVYTISHEPDKRSSSKFFHTLINLGEIMNILEMLPDLEGDYKLPAHLESPQ